MVTKYDLECNDYNDYSMNVQPDGDYVEWDDYEALEKKYEALCKMIEQIYREI